MSSSHVQCVAASTMSLERKEISQSTQVSCKYFQSFRPYVRGLFLAPVVVTAQSYLPSEQRGPFPMTLQTNEAISNQGQVQPVNQQVLFFRQPEHQTEVAVNRASSTNSSTTTTSTVLNLPTDTPPVAHFRSFTSISRQSENEAEPPTYKQAIRS